MLAIYRNWKLRTIKKLLLKGASPHSKEDLKAVIETVHKIPLKVLTSMTPEHRGFVTLYTYSPDIFSIRNTTFIAFRDLADDAKIEYLFRNYVKRPLKTKTLTEFLGPLSNRPDSLGAKLDDITRTLDLILKTIQVSQEPGFLFRLHEPLFEDYFALIEAIVLGVKKDVDKL